MKNLPSLLAVPLLGMLASPAFCAPAAPAKQPPEAREVKPDRALRAVASDVAGTIKFRLAPQAQWQALGNGTVLPVGADVLAGPGGRARIQMGPGVFLVLKPFSRVTIARLKMDGAGDAATVRATLAKQYGRVEFDVRDAGFKNDFKIASPNGVMAVKGTGGEHDNFGADEWVVGVPRNKDHAIEYANLVAGYRAFLSANQGVSTRFPSVDAFAAMLDRLDPDGGNALFALLANQGQGGDTSGVTDWQAVIREAESLGDAPAVEQGLENWRNRWGSWGNRGQLSTDTAPSAN